MADRKKTLSEDQWAGLIARQFVTEDGIKTLMWEEATKTFWRYEAGAWDAMPESEMTRIVRNRVIVSEPFTMNRGKDIAAQMAYEVDRHDVLDDGWLAFEDGSWNPDTDEFAPHSPARFATVRVPAPFNALPRWQDAPTFSGFLDSVCVGPDLSPNHAMRDLLQEMFGYCLMARNERAVSFFLSGEGRNGKGVLLDVLRAMLNPAKVSDLSLTDLSASRFATSELVAMRLNIGDESNTAREAVSDMFKRLTGSTFVKGERKFGATFTFRMRCKLVFTVNGVPTFDGFGKAMRERIIAVPFWRTFEKHERVYGLAERITREEMPSVVAWAVEGLRRLRANNLVFTEYAEERELLASFEHLSDAFADFLTGWERHDGEDRAFFHAFYAEYRAWCEDNGRKALSSRKVALRVRSLFGDSRQAFDRSRGYSVATVPLRPVRPSPQQQGLAVPVDGLEAFGGRVVGE